MFITGLPAEAVKLAELAALGKIQYGKWACVSGAVLTAVHPISIE